MNALTIDLEDWYHPELVSPYVGDKVNNPQIQNTTKIILKLLSSFNIRATFFVVGEVAKKFPALVQEIHSFGHEIGCHGMTHKPLWALTPDSFRKELSDFSNTMRNIVGIKDEIIGFRAPTFSLTNKTSWAIDILNESGYKYDSSIFSMKTPLYGVSKGILTHYHPNVKNVGLHDPKQKLIEIPVTINRIGSVGLPVSGGFYFRLFPYWFLQYNWKCIEKRRPLVIYLHPWELTKETPRWQLPMISRFVTYHNLGGTISKLTKMVKSFRFGTLRDMIYMLDFAHF